MKPTTLSDLARRYGYFLDFLDRSGLLDHTRGPAAHVTPENVAGYLKELKERLSSVTVHGSVYKLRRASQLLDPMAETDHLAARSDIARARQFRNGLMVAMLALHPIRLANVASLEIGQNFVSIQGQWWIVLDSGATKENRPDERRLDEILIPALEAYLLKYRDIPAQKSASNALWLSSANGHPMTYGAVAATIEQTTRTAIGVGLSPHLFRAAAASTAAIHAGQSPYLASALLHHRDPRITEEHYNHATSLSAANEYARIIRHDYD